MDDKEIDALISLLDDNDSEIIKMISDKIVSLGTPIISHLEKAWEHSFDPVFQKRVEILIQSIQHDWVIKGLRQWLNNGANSVLEGALWVAKYQYPDLNEDKIVKQLEHIRKDLWIELNDNLTAIEQVKVINKIFFDIHGFSGNTANIQAPQNNYINHVIENKKGNPLTLSILYIHLCSKMDIPVFGVNLPQQFVLAYKDDSSISRLFSVNPNDKILFYINPFNKGAIFTRKEIDSFLLQINLERKEEYYSTCSNKVMIVRMLNNLISSYAQMGYEQKVRDLQKIKTEVFGE